MGGGVWTNVWEGVNRREAHIYIKKYEKTQKIQIIGGGGVVYQLGGGSLPPRGCVKISLHLTCGLLTHEHCPIALQRQNYQGESYAASRPSDRKTASLWYPRADVTSS